MGLHKILKIVAFALAIIGAIFALMLIAGDDDSDVGMAGNMLYVAYAVLGLVIAMVLVFVVKGLFAGNVKKTLMSVGAFLAVVIIGYAASSGTDLSLTPFLEKGLDVTESTSKNVGAGLIIFYILAILAIASMAYSGVKKIFNK
ncbi:hypothetical protein [Seonamhaeicola marinus]|uniref:Uncharacterized protein n=1 Tax=Seonamhaeicola marinus TaxID=1912246 RepID=A0A5D0HT04_9FLAO|nr:hypothetical protein [Seonamhaeicola marinus]TYA74503.1 hypothetical protein FUA24_14365 [Seonamhaeicola marinus]